jgi:hypothetical protein
MRTPEMPASSEAEIAQIGLGSAGAAVRQITGDEERRITREVLDIPPALATLQPDSKINEGRVDNSVATRP